MTKRNLQSSKAATTHLEQEIILQINQRLFEKGVIPRDVYEQAKVKLVS